MDEKPLTSPKQWLNRLICEAPFRLLTMFACFECKFETSVASEFAIHLQTKHSEAENNFLSSSNPAKVKVEMIPTLPSSSEIPIKQEAIESASDNIEQILVQPFIVKQVISLCFLRQLEVINL